MHRSRPVVGLNVGTEGHLRLGRVNPVAGVDSLLLGVCRLLGVSLRGERTGGPAATVRAYIHGVVDDLAALETLLLRVRHDQDPFWRNSGETRPTEAHSGLLAPRGVGPLTCEDKCKTAGQSLSRGNLWTSLITQRSQVQILPPLLCDVSGHRHSSNLRCAGSGYCFLGGPGGRPVGW